MPPDRDGTPTPTPTKAALVATVALTVSALAMFAAAHRNDARFTASFLSFFSVLFVVRVLGQLVVRTWRPTWLPPTEQWNLTPYRLLLLTQLAIIGVMAWIAASFWAEDGGPATRHEWFGVALLAFAGLYAAAMIIRYAVRMTRRPSERWFGGAIPIVFHWVLAAYLAVFGTYHVAN
jgi:hypothetical protein